MINMSAKFDKETRNGVVSIVFTRSTHGQTDGTTEPQQRYYIRGDNKTKYALSSGTRIFQIGQGIKKQKISSIRRHFELNLFVRLNGSIWSSTKQISN